MLCRYAQVDREGNYTRAAKAQLAYGALIGGRGHLINVRGQSTLARTSPAAE